MKALKLSILALLLSAIMAVFIFKLGQFAKLSYIKEQQALLVGYYQANQLLVILAFALIYLAVTALSLPLAAILTLLSGALFGFVKGLIIVSFASTIGATLAFLASRFLFRELVQTKYAKALSKLNDGIKKEGAFYLFALRLVPAIPFFMINLLMGLTPIKSKIFYLISQLGMLPGSAIYVYAGTELGKIENLDDITSPSLLIALALLGLLPIILKKL